MLYLKLFEDGYTSACPLRGTIKPRDIDYLRRIYHFNNSAISAYYSERNFAAKNTNLLSRLVELINPDLNNTADRYSEIISTRIPYIGKHFRLTSELEKGVVHDGPFFGKGNEEIVMSVNDYFDPFEVERNWKHQKVLTVYKHNINDMKLLLPSGKTTGSRTGLCSVGVNLPKLALMFRCFVREQERNAAIGKEVLNKNFFVYKYVFSNNLEQITDHAVLNRIMDAYYGKQTVLPKFKHPFKIYEPYTQLNRHAENTLDVITDKELSFVDIMHNIHLPYTNTALTLLNLPEVAPNIQITWALLASRLEHMCFMLDIGGKHSTNSHYINDWKRAVKRVERDSHMNEMFTFETHEALKEKMYKISNW